LVEQYFDFAKELADKLFVMDRGAMVLSGARSDINDPAVRRLISV
jgi:urea transport system ATP-binding protein